MQEPKKVVLWNKPHFEEKNGECAACLKYSVLIVVEKIYEMQHLEGSGTPVLYIGRTVLKGYISLLFHILWSRKFDHSSSVSLAHLILTINMRNMSLCCHCSIDDEYQPGAKEKEINSVCAHRLYRFCQHNIWCKLGFTFVPVELTNKMQPCNKIYYSTVYWRLNMFRAAYRSSSGALTVFAASGLHRHVMTERSQVW